MNRCHLCGKRLWGGGLFYTPGEGLDEPPIAVCRSCARTAPRCAVCGVPVGAEHVLLADGRRICVYCHRTAVYDTFQARQLFEYTARIITAHLGLQLRIGTEFTLTDARHLERLVQEAGLLPHNGESKVVGLFTRKGPVRVMYVLSGLPRTLFIQTIAHEWAHAWQGENCPLLEDPLLREGFAEWVAYKTLQAAGAVKKLQFMEQQDSMYGRGLRKMLQLERERGSSKIFELCRKGEWTG